MIERSIENLRRQSYQHRFGAAVFVTALAAVVLVPVWMWNASNVTGIRSKAIGSEKSDTASAASIFPQEDVSIPNPIVEMDNTLQKKFSEPIKIIESGLVEGQFMVKFSAENSTFGQLTAPFSQAYLVERDNPTRVVAPDRAVTPDGGQLVPAVQPSQTKEGLLYFSDVSPGLYELRFPGLRYAGEEQTTFIQTLEVKVGGALQPRT